MRLAALALLLAPCVLGQSLKESLQARIAGFSGAVSLYAKNLDSGAAIGIGDTDKVRTASTIKIAIMMAVFDQVARGQAKWTDPLTVTAAEKVSGSGILDSEISDGVQLPIRDVMHLMMVLSDNTATNMLLERFTADAVNAYLDKLGIKTTRSLRKILGNGPPAGVSAAGKLPENQKYGLGVSTPRDMVTMLEKLYRGEIVSADASREMLDVMKRCQDNTGIRRKLPAVTIANKIGALDALRSDVGIVYSQGGPVAMAITVDGIPAPDWGPDNPGSVMISDLAKLLVDGLARK
jgi:beta-lactamase class A